MPLPLWVLFLTIHLGLAIAQTSNEDAKHRLELLQIDAAATGAVAPSTDPSIGELTWSLAPRARASIHTTGQWMNLPGNTLSFSLQEPSHVVVKYQMIVLSNQLHHAGGDFINSGQSTSTVVSDFLGARLLLDGMPSRQSGSHAAPIGALEISTRQLSGYIITRLGVGNHTVSLQWRKWGTQVSSWTVSPILFDGYETGRSLTVSSQHKYLWYNQPLSVARTVVSSNKWHTIRDMTIKFMLPRDWILRLKYAIQVRPQGSGSHGRSGGGSGPNTDVLLVRDYLSTRIVLDGRAYRESSSVSSSSTRTYGCSTLTGEVTLKIPAGEHNVRVEWKTTGSGRSVPLWWSHPNFLDGFVSGRMLTVEGEMHPFQVAQPLADVSIRTPTYQGNNHSSTWHDIRSTAINFNLGRFFWCWCGCGCWCGCVGVGVGVGFCFMLGFECKKMF